MAESEKKMLIRDLRVVDLKSELEKRSLETTGVKTILIERLSQALKDEGHDPDEYLFEINVAKGKPGKPSSPLKTAKEPEKEQEKDEEQATPAEAAEEPTSNIEEDELIIKNDDDIENDCFEEVDRIGEDDEVEATKEKIAENKEEIKADDNIETSTNDNEDSLNLTIGEEEELLLRDEENDVKAKDSKPADAAEDTKEETVAEKTGDDNDAKTTSAPGQVKTVGKDEVSAPPTTANSTSSVKTKITAPTSNGTSTSNNALSRNLWVSGLSSLTRATDLKLIFSKYGKVIGAKVVTNTRSPGQRCFGYVTMSGWKDASECIKNLHKTELHGRIISVERAKSDLGPPKANSAAGKPVDAKASAADKKKEADPSAKKVTSTKDSDRKDSRKPNDKSKDDPKSAASSSTSKPERKRISPPRSDSKEKPKAKSRERQVDRARPARSKSPGKKEREILSFNKMREERKAREEERRRREYRQRQREEEERLIALRRRTEAEREKLALERRRIEEQKAELLRIERERQKLEREKLALERLELKRQQRKIEEAKRAIKRPLSTDRYDRDDDRDRDRKRSTRDNRGFEVPPPPPRFETSSVSRSSNYDRDRGTSDIKKRLDDFPAKREDSSYSSKRDSFKPKRVDYKAHDSRDLPRHSSSSYGTSSSRIEPAAALSKDRYAERSTSDYRATASRSDERDSRNGGGSSKQRYLEPPVEPRFNERPAVASSGAWNSGASHQAFGGGMNAANIWSENKQEVATAWRGLDAGNRYERFDSMSDRKPVIPTNQYIDPNLRPQFVSNIIPPSAGGRFSSNNRGYADHGRF